MAKKNEFIMTIGFNRNDVGHVKAAEILNRLGRSKAHYIAKAVLAYEEAMSCPPSSAGIDDPVDYSYIRRIVEEVIGQHVNRLETGADRQPSEEGVRERTEGNGKQIGENEKGSIMASLKAFRSGSF